MDLRISLEGNGRIYDEQARAMSFEKALVCLEGLQTITLIQTIPMKKGSTTYASYRLTFGPKGGLKVEHFDGEVPEEGE